MTCVLDVDIQIGCRDSVGESHVRRVKCVAVVNNTLVVTGDRLVFYPRVIGLAENRNESLLRGILFSQ